MVKQANISVNKLAEYVMSRGARQRQILKQRKYPDEDFSIGMYHREAAESISLYLSAGAVDPTPIENQIKNLKQITTEKVGTARRINANIDAMERFLEMLDDVDFAGGEPSLGANNAPSMTFHNVRVSVRPEIVLRGSGPKNKKFVGGFKLHFAVSHPMNEESAGYVSAIVQEFSKFHLAQDDEIVNPEYCKVIDVASGNVFRGVKATTQRMKDVAAECQNIAALWPSI